MSTLTATQLQQQYIAYFGRPGDPAGIKYWLSSTSGISSAREFADKIYAQDEYKKSTVGSKSTEAQVNSLYQNLFGREADAAGLIYWTGQIEAGTLTLSNIAYDLIAAASNPVAGNETQGAADALALSNKVSAAEAFTADVEASTSAILAYQPESTTPWTTGAAFDSGKSYLAGITTTAHTASGIDSAVATMISANTTAGSTVASTTSKFTTGQDVLTGGAGDDIFNGVLIKSGDTGTTVAPGDQVDGGAGTDTVNISVSGLHAASYTLEALDTDKVEKVLVSNYETNNSRETTVSGSLFDSSITTVGLSSSSATGDTTFSGLTQKVGAEMRNGAANLTITYDSTVLSGAADVQDLTVSAVTAGTFGAAGAETISINTELAKSTLTDISSTDLATLKISGDQALTISNALTTKTIDASGSTGGVTLTLGSANQTVTGGSGDDTIDGVGVVTKDDTIDGGLGTDTLKLEIGASTYDGEKDDELYNVSGFEVVQVNATGAATLELDTLWDGITTVEAAGNQKVITFANAADNNTDSTFAVTINGSTYTSASVDMSNGQAADLVAVAAAVATVIDAESGFTAVSDGTSAVTITNTSSTSEILEISYTTTVAQTATITDYSDVTFADAAGTEVVDIYAGGKVVYNLKDASGTADVANINLKVLDADKAVAQTVTDIDIANIETLNLSATGLKSTVTQTLSNISGDASLTTLNITGSNNLTITDHATDNTKLVTIDASTYTGDLTFSDAAAAKQTITTGTGNDTVVFAANLTEDDVIDLGGNTTLTTGVAGKDKVTATGNLGTAVDNSVLQISNVETFELAVGGGAATYIDASKLVNTTNLAFSDTGGTVKLINLPAGTTIGAGIGTTELGSSTTTTLDVTLADETGTDDSITIDFSDTIDAASKVTFKSTGIETLNISATKESGNAAASTFVFGDNAPSKIVVTDGVAEDTVDLGTLNKTTTNVDGGAYKGILKAVAATGIATTVSASGKVANIITTSTGADTVTLKGDLGTTVNDISLAAGTDVLNIESLSALASDFTKVDGVETINITVKDSTSAGFNATGKDGGLQTATAVNILGGNGLSKFVMTTATFDDNTIAQTVDSSTFAGAIELNFASNALDSTVTVKGGSSTSDKITTIIADTANKPASITGVESIVVKSTENDLAASFDMANVTGATSVSATYVTTTKGDQIELDNVPAALTVKVATTSATNTDDDVLDIGYADASTTTTVANVEITSFTATNDQLDLDIAGVETLNLYNKGGAATNEFDLAGVSATTGSNVKIVVTGTGATLESLHSTVNEIDASSATGAVTLTAANRPATAMTITTSTGDDSIGMESPSDVISAGTGTDTLTITGYGVLGGFAVDLSSTTDQVTQFAGVTNALTQVGFESVSGSGITGSFGLDVIGSSGSNTITGTSNPDVLRGGAGTDTIVQTAGVDELHGGTGVDRFTLSDIVHSNAPVIDTIKDFTVGSSGDTFELSVTDIEQITGITDIVSVSETTDSLAEDQTLAVVTVTGDLDMDTTEAEIAIIDNTTAYDLTSIKASIVAAGDREIISDGVRAVADGFLIMYDDNADSYLASVQIATSTVTDGGDLVASKTTVKNLVKFEGIADATGFTGDNIRIALA